MAGPHLTPFRYDVFLSHSSADKPVVRELAEGLRAAGLRVWLDDWIIRPGDLISAKIEEGLEQSAVLLLCMSANAFGSDWVTLEGHTAIFRDPQNLERRFVPLRLDDAPIKAMLRGYAFIDWRAGADREGAWGRLLGACGVGGGEGQIPATRPQEGTAGACGLEGPDQATGPVEGAGATPVPSPTTASEARDSISPASASLEEAVSPPALQSPRPGSEEPRPTAPQPRSLKLFHPGPVRSVAWSGDGRRVVSGGDDGTLRLWDAASGRELAVLEGHQGEVISVAWSGDGRHVVSGGEDETVRLWEAERGRELAVLKGHVGCVRSVGWSSDGLRVVSGGWDRTVRLWEVKSGQELAVLVGHQGEVNSVGWSVDGKHVVSGVEDGMVWLWDVERKRDLAEFVGHQGGVNSVGWSGDGRRVVSGGDDGTVRLWEVKSGRELAVLEGHDWRVMSVGWSGDGRRVVSGGDDATVRLWEAESGRPLAVLEGHKGGVRSVGWSGDGRRVVSGGDDGTVRLWEAESGRPLAVLGGLSSLDGYGRMFLWGPVPLQPQAPAANGESLSDTTTEDDSLPYTNAKVLVVGDSGAGKTGLTHRLATGSFQPSESTIGAWCTHWPLPQPTATAGDPQREVWLWDFGGQADQRLIHQLFLDRAALVLLLFDASRDEVLEGLHDWQTALRRTLPDPPPQLMVAARVDAGFRASRARLEAFAAEQGLPFLETSARDGSGCEALQRAIHDTIAWDQLPRHTSPRLFREIKAEILRLRDEGEALLTYKDLRERLRQRVRTPGLDDATLQTVIGLLDGPGVLKQLDYGFYVLLKPEWLGVYGQAVLRRLRQAEPQLGALPVGAIAAAQLPFAEDQSRLEPPEEQVLLAELERQLQERKICLRQGGQLVFPSHCGRERPPSPALPAKFVSYAVRGWLDEIHATLVVSLAETRVFRLENLWRDAADFRTLATTPGASGRAMAVQLRRDNASEGLVTLHVGPEVADAERVQFAQFIDAHLRQVAETVERRRHWTCPHCHAAKDNEAVLMRKLERDGERAKVVCDDCDKSFLLYDNLERLFADTTLRRQAEALGERATPQLTARRKGKLLVLEVGARLTSANQKWQEITPDEDDGLDLQVEFTDDDGNGTGAYLYLQLKAGPSHLRRRADGGEIFTIKKPRWVHTWTQQPFPVMLVIGQPAGLGAVGDPLDPDHLPSEPFGSASTSRFKPGSGRRSRFFFASRADHRAFPDVRWMEIRSVLRRELEAGRSPEQIRQIDFHGEPLDMASVLRWRRKILEGWQG